MEIFLGVAYVVLGAFCVASGIEMIRRPPKKQYVPILFRTDDEREETEEKEPAE